MTVDIAELRDNIANFDDFFRPMRNYLYWEPHCYNIPVCWSIRSVFDTLDGIDIMTDDIQAAGARSGTPRCADAAAGRADARADRDDEDDEGNDADDVCHPEGHAGSAGGAAGELDRDGRRVRRLDERRFVLSAARGLRQRGLQTRHGELHFTRRQVGALHHRARRRSGHTRGYRAHQRDQDGGQGSHQGHSVGRFHHLPGRHRGDLQGHARRVELRPVDRRNVRSGTRFSSSC